MSNASDVSTGTILPATFFEAPTLDVAERLIGMYLVRERDGAQTALMITEVEAYDGWDDKASHASRGRTARNAPMFGAAGTIYVYFVYGMYWMLNIVCGPADHPAAILIRGVGTGTARVNGPARLTKALGIDKTFNDKPLDMESGLWIEDRGAIIDLARIKRTPRIGVAYAGESAQLPWRFVLEE